MGKNKGNSEMKILDVDASMQGTITFRDPVNLRINGSFEGKLDTRGSLSIGENATVNADICGDRIIVAGKVYGNIYAAEHLSIVSPALIQGNIKTPQLVVSEGAIVNGTIDMGGTVDASGDDDVIGLKDVAIFLEVETAIVEDWAAKRKIPAFRENGVWKFHKAAIERWIQEEKVRV